jgi:hypothetical protein
MTVLTLIIIAATLILAKFLIGRFVQPPPVNNQTAYLNAYRYVGYMIVFCFLGLMGSTYIVINNLAGSVPRLLVVLGPLFVGALIGAILAHKFPGSLRK